MSASPPATPRYAIYFSEDHSAFTSPPTPVRADGYLLVRPLSPGGNAAVALVRSLSSGKLFVRKYARPLARNPAAMQYIEPHELHFAQTLPETNPAFFPAFHSSATLPGDPTRVTALVTSYCNGGSAFNWFRSHHTPESIEVIAWICLRDTLRTLAFLHEGYRADAPVPTPSPVPWRPIFHGDMQTQNIFLHFPDGALLPSAVVGDFGHTRYEQDGEWAAEDDMWFVHEIRALLLALNTPEQPYRIPAQLAEVFGMLNELGNNMTARQLLGEVEGRAQERIGSLVVGGGLDLNPPVISDSPMLFDLPKVDGRAAGLVKPWRWVRVDERDADWRAVELVGEEADDPIALTDTNVEGTYAYTFQVDSESSDDEAP